MHKNWEKIPFFVGRFGMKVVHPSIFLLIKRFPERKDILSKLYLESTSFQSMCEDYRACNEALTHWNNMDSDEAGARRKEYGELIQSLESEIIRCLNETRL